jgi:hypothetical protein
MSIRDIKNTSSGIIFNSTWRACCNLTTFPVLSFDTATSMTYTWAWCENLTGYTQTKNGAIINTSGVTNFKGCWAYTGFTDNFPSLDTSNGTNFSYTWAGSQITGLPDLDFGSADNFQSTFYDCKKLLFVPSLQHQVSLATNFNSMFMGCNSLLCIVDINTTNMPPITPDLDPSEDMFTDCNSLMRPTPEEIADITDAVGDDGQVGLDWVNDSDCPVQFGFLVSCLCETGAETSFEIDTPCTVDWGNNAPGDYPAGVVTGTPVSESGDTLSNVKITTAITETTTSITFLSDTYNSISLLAAKDITDATSMCQDLTTLTSFVWQGECNVQNLTDTWNNCTSLTTFSIADTSNVTSFQNTWAGTAISTFDPMDFSVATNFQGTFRDNTVLTFLPPINSDSGTEFDNIFNNCSGLVCLAEINTQNQTSTTDMFTGCTLMERPNASEQASIMAGLHWTNNQPCPLEYPYPPRNFNATDYLETGVECTWLEPSNGADTYNLYRDMNLLASGITEFSYFDSNVEEGVTYEYFVTGVNIVDEGDPSIPDTGKIRSTILDHEIDYNDTNMGLFTYQRCWTVRDDGLLVSIDEPNETVTDLTIQEPDKIKEK